MVQLETWNSTSNHVEQELHHMADVIIYVWNNQCSFKYFDATERELSSHKENQTNSYYSH